MTTATDKFAGIRDIVTSIEDVQTVLGEPMPQVLIKEIDHLDDICRYFIAKAPFCVIASANPDGYIDVSPKGDPVGFVRVLDEKHLAIPDRPGNRRADTFHNLLRDPRLGILFIIPGKTETLRVSGEARISRDESLRQSMPVNGKVPALAVVVHVERVFMHCPKCMVRSKIWQPEEWPDASKVAKIDKAMIQHCKLDMTPEELYAEVVRTGTDRLY
jgi:PPOX class probable FMN-dependent enzyme